MTAAILIAVVAAGTGGQQTFRTDAQIIELKQSIALDKDAMAEATQADGLLVIKGGEFRLIALFYWEF